MVQAGAGIGAGHGFVAPPAGTRIAFGGLVHGKVQRVPVVAAEGQQPAQQMQVGMALVLRRREQRQQVLQPRPAAQRQQLGPALRQHAHCFVPGAGPYQEAHRPRQIRFVLGGALQQPGQQVGVQALQPVFEEVAEQVVQAQRQRFGVEHADE